MRQRKEAVGRESVEPAIDTEEEDTAGTCRGRRSPHTGRGGGQASAGAVLHRPVPSPPGPRRGKAGCQVPARLSSRDTMKPRATEPSPFAGKGGDAHTAGWRCPRCCPGRWLTDFLGPQPPPSASPPTGLSLDRLDVICWVQANLPVVQASLAPALLILILYFGELIPCRTKREGSW